MNSCPDLSQENLRKTYNYWRKRIFFGIYFGYIFYYLTRRSFVAGMPFLIEDLGFEKVQLGFLASVFSITYAISKFLSGGIADRVNPRYFMAFGLLFTGVLNIGFGLSSSLLFFTVFWGLNGWFQGWGAPPCARLLTYWFAQKERGRWWGFWNTSHSLGSFVIPFVVIACAVRWGWRSALFVPGGFCILASFFLMHRLRDTPESLGLPAVEVFANEAPSASSRESSSLSVKEIFLRYVLSNKYVWILGVAYFFVYIVRMAIGDWGALFLIESKGYSILSANAAVVCLEVGGVLGSLAAGVLSDKIFLGRRAPVSILFSLGIVTILGLLWAIPGNAFVLHSILFFFAGFLIFGPQMLIGIAAVELSDKRAAGTATGFVGCIAYFGAAVAGLPLSWVAQQYGWEGFMTTIIGSAGVAAILLLPLWKLKSLPGSESVPVASEDPETSA